MENAMENDSAGGIAPAPAPAPEPEPSGPEPSDMTKQLSQKHEMARAEYDKLRDSEKRVHMMRKQLDHLVALGDKASGEDLSKAASRCVAAGVDAKQMAVLLSEAPGDGPALANWARQKDEVLQGVEQQLESMLKDAKFNLGLNAMHVIAGVAMDQHAQKMQSAPAQSAPAQSATPPINALNTMPSGVDAGSVPDTSLMMGGQTNA